MATQNATAAASKVRDIPHDDMESYRVMEEVLMEVDSISEVLLRSTELDRIALRTLGMRLRELSNVARFAIDNANESQVTWVELRARLTGINAEA